MSYKSFSPCPFCGSEPRYLENKPGYWTERVICDHCDFHLPPAKWQARAEPDMLQSATLQAGLATRQNTLANTVHKTTDKNLDLFYNTMAEYRKPK